MEKLDYKFYAEILKIKDGDTAKVLVDLGFSVFCIQSIRIKGLNAPELNKSEESKAGKASRDYLMTLLPVGSKVLIKTEKYRQSFTRYVGDIYREDGSNVAELLVAAGHAVKV